VSTAFGGLYLEVVGSGDMLDDAVASVVSDAPKEATYRAAVALPGSG
jgi:hypothetical protein